jgi:hypothetical protein
MSRFLASLLLLAAAAAAREDPRRTPAGREVEGYLAESAGIPLLSAAANAQGGSGWASLRLDAWFPALDGTIDDEGGGQINVTNDLGLDNNELALVPRVLLSLGRVGFLFDMYRFKSEGNGTLTATVDFGGVTFQFNENVVSDVDILNVRTLMTIRVWKSEPFQLTLLAGFSYYDLEVVMQGTVSGTGRAAAQLPVPLLGVLCQGRIGRFLLEAEVSGLAADYEDFDVTYLDVQASVGFTFLKVVAVRVGYRITSLDGTVDEFDMDGTLDGFFVGAAVNF